MSHSDSGDSRSRRSSRLDVVSGRGSQRENAREKAKTIRELHRKQDKRGRIVRNLGVTALSLGIVAVIAIVLLNSVRPAAPGPLNMKSDGILIGQNFVATPTAGLDPGEVPVPNVRDAKSDVIAIQVYLDYMCPICGDFEQANGSQLSAWVKSGAATVEFHPIAILDRVAQGTRYSSRAVNAAACVANYSPNQYFDFNTILFEHQPKENTGGLTDAQLIKLANDAKVRSATEVAACIRDQKFANWVVQAKDRALTGPIPGSNVAAVTATPTVIVNGVRFTGAPTDAAAFSAFVVQAAGTNFNENSSATPTPTPSPSPAG